MNTKKQNKIAAGTTAVPELQEVKLQGILLAEITLETSTKDLLEIMKIKGHYTHFWFDNSGQRISDCDALSQNIEAFPLRLWRFPSKIDLERDLEEQ